MPNENLFYFVRFSIFHQKSTFNFSWNYVRFRRFFEFFQLYSFNNFEDFCVLCEFLSNTNFPLTNIAKNISLYLYNNTYYLVFIKPNLSYPYLKTLLAIISEFSNGNIKKK